MNDHPNFVSDIDLDNLPIPVKVFSRYEGQNYDDLDALAEKKGYQSVETSQDEKFYSEKGNGLVGLQNSNLHSGWIATIDDYNVKAMQQIGLLKEKIDKCKAEGEDVIVGFCQTGQFSIGYSIYVKET